MAGNNGILSRLIVSLLVLVSGWLLTVTPCNAAEGGPSDQHVEDISGDKTWNRDITESYWIEESGSYKHFGVFLDTGSTADSYSVDSAISLNLAGLSGNTSTTISGIDGSDISGDLHVGGKINITGAGWMPENGAVTDKFTTGLDVFGVQSGGRINSSANITIQATGGNAIKDAQATAFGIATRDEVKNKGTISVSAKGGKAGVGKASRYTNTTAYGIISYNKIKNHGDISVSATGGKSEGDGGDARANATGISISGYEATNSGSITVTAQAGTIKKGDRIISSKATAYGIRFRGTGTLSSSGLITASAQLAPNVDPPTGMTTEAYQVFSKRGTLTINEYAMEVGHKQDVFTRMYEGQIGTSTDDGEIVFDKTKLVVHVADNYQDGVYDIPRLWKQEKAEQKEKTINQFAVISEVVGNVPGLDVSLINSTDVGTP